MKRPYLALKVIDIVGRVTSIEGNRCNHPGKYISLYDSLKLHTLTQVHLCFTLTQYKN